MYEALAAKTAKMSRLVISSVTIELRNANTQPLKSGIMIAKVEGNHPKVKVQLAPNVCYGFLIVS